MALATPVLILGIYWAPLRSSIDGAMHFYRSEPPIALAPQTPDPDPRP
jgi:ABC-type nitrate/sulfonate/bicarbonate transport system permease component